MKKKVISIVIAIIAIIAATLGILYFTTDLFKTPEQLFYRHFAQNSKMLGANSYSQALEEMKKTQESSYTINGEITGTIKGNGSSTKQIADALGKGKINYTIKNIGAEQKTQTDMVVNYDNKDIVTLNVLNNKEQYGIRVKDVYDKYISVENNNLKALFKKLGINEENLPDKIQMLDMYEFLNIDKATLSKISNTYMNVLKENIPSNAYAIEKGIVVKFGNEDVKANAYKLTLTEEQVKNIMIKVLETLKTDDTTLDLIVTKYNKLATINQYAMEKQTLTKEELVKSINEALEDAKDLNAGSGKLQIVTYTTNDNKTRYEIIVDETKITMDMSKQNQARVAEVTINEEGDTVKATTTYEGNNVNTVISADMDEEVLEINIKQSIIEDKGIQIEDFTKENSVKLNDMSAEEINSLVQTIYTNVMKVLPEKMQLLGIQ